MSDVNRLITQYLGIWNERDEARRNAIIKEVMTEDSVYSDPDYAGIEGHAALSAAIGTAHEKFGDLVFGLGEIIGAHHDTALFTWRLGPAGTDEAVGTGYDVIEFADGRIRRVVGFF
ncbi:nuclear transport factor 2 family protein [Actinoallomurus sp. NPDC052308]|uniref:nuclear transport factor 2 family protein n=1 Tax=Actinoallomurus sp. NPDC052308 TaxID=3155530 RepID=UPI003443B6B1